MEKPAISGVGGDIEVNTEQNIHITIYTLVEGNEVTRTLCQV